MLQKRYWGKPFGLTCFLGFLFSSPWALAGGTVTVEIYSSPSSVTVGQLVDVTVRFMFSGDDNDGPWQVETIAIRDDDIWPAYNTISSVTNPGTISSQNTWYYYTFSSIRLSDWDDGGNGMELYAWVEIDDNDLNGYSPDGSSAIRQVSVVQPPDLYVSTSSLNFGSSSTSGTFNIRNDGGGTLSYNVSDDRSWLSVSSTSGSSTGESDTITVTVNRSGLSEGNYSGIVSITSNGGSASVSVAMSVPSQSGTVTVELVSPPGSVQVGELVDIQVRIKYDGDNDGPWQVTDLDLYDDDGVTWNTIRAASNPLTISNTGQWYYYTFSSVRLSDWDDGGNGIELYTWGEVDDNDTNGFNPDDSSPIQQVSVVQPPDLYVSTSGLSFGSSSTSQTFTIRNDGGGTLSYNVSDDRSWLSVSPTSGSSTGESDTITVTVNRSGLSEGNYSGTVSVSSNGGSAPVSVSMTVPSQSGTVTVELVSPPSSVQMGELVDLQVRIKYDGDNDGPWQVTDLNLRDDDGVTWNTIQTASNPLTISNTGQWYSYTFQDVRLSDFDDGGDGVELYGWGEVDDNDTNGFNPDDSSPVSRVTVAGKINSAYWWAPLDVTAGTVATMCAEVEGFSIGNSFTFEIFEDDGLLGSASAGTRTGQVYASGGKLYARATWTAAWENDQSGDPEYFFKVSKDGVELESSKDRSYELRVHQGVTPTYNTGEFSYSPDLGEATDMNTPLDDRIPVILVHGMSGENNSASLNYWYWWCEEFNRAAHRYDYKVYRYIYASDKNISENGAELADFVVNYDEFAGRKVIVLAHSMGGLVSRYALNTHAAFREKVLKLVTLGSPHLGSPAANPPWVYANDLGWFTEGVYDAIAFNGTAGAFDLAWYSTAEIPAAASSTENLNKAYERWDWALVDASRTAPFTGSSSMTSTVGDPRVMAFGGNFFIMITDGLGGADTTPEIIREEVGWDHWKLDFYARPALSGMRKDNGAAFISNDGLVPVESALANSGHPGIEMINVTDAAVLGEEVDHSSYLDVPTIITFVMAKITQIEDTDTTSPTVSISSPSNGQTFTSASVTVSGTASDPGSPSSGVALVEVRLNGGSWQSASGTTSWSKGVTLASGGNTIEARSKDSAGNYSTIASVSVTYNPPDTTPPTVSISSPSNGQTFTSASVTVSGSASDPGSPSSGVALVEVRLNGGSWQTASGTTSWSKGVTLASGPNTIDARSKDNAGNYSTVASVSVTYNPDVEYMLSVNSSGATSVSISSGTGHDGTTNYGLIIPSGTTVSLTAPPSASAKTFSVWSAAFPNVFLPGQQTITFEVTENTTVTAIYVSDTTAPTVSISSPSNGQTFTSSSVTVSGSASDPGSPSSGLALIEVRLNGGSWQSASGTTSWSKGVTLASGGNTIEARSKDSAGNYSTIASVSVTYSTDTMHPADTNEDWRLSIDEITAYGAAWKRGDTWPVPPNPIPIDYVTNAGMLWKSGETYHYVAEETPPQCWQSGGALKQFLEALVSEMRTNESK